MKKWGLVTAAFLLVLGVLGLGSCSSTKDETLTSTLGGREDDRAFAVQQTSDGGYIVAGEKGYTVDKEWNSEENKWDLNVSHTDIWVIKLDSDRDKSWEKSFGELSLDEEAYSVQQTTDGGFIVAGSCQNGATFVDNGCVFKLDSAGGLQWQKSFLLLGNDRARSIRQTSDGGFIVAGTATDYSSTNSDAWVAKLDSAGNTVWGNLYNGSGDSFDGAYAVREISGGYIVAGYSFGLAPLDFNAWVFTLDTAGVQLGNATYDFGGNDGAYDIQPTSDGGFIVAAARYPISCASGDCREESVTMIFKLDNSLNKIWEKGLWGKLYARAYSIVQSSDSGFVAAGYTENDDGANKDLWVIKLAPDQSTVWEKTFSGLNDDLAWAIAQTFDGGYIVAGETGSYGEGGFDAWVLKLDANGECHGDSCPGAK